MDSDLIAGILTKPGRRSLAMVVDCRVAKTLDALPEREATIQFAPCVSRVRLLEGGKAIVSPGSTVRLKLEAGAGQLLEIQGHDVATLADRAAIYRRASF